MRASCLPRATVPSYALGLDATPISGRVPGLRNSHTGAPRSPLRDLRPAGSNSRTSVLLPVWRDPVTTTTGDDHGAVPGSVSAGVATVLSRDEGIHHRVK